MLEDIAATPWRGTVFRLVNQAEYVKALQEMGIDVQGISEVVSLLQERGLKDDPADILDGPFAFKPNLKPYQTRFSDGTVRVFYSSLDSETAEREQAHWYKRLILQGQQRPIKMYFRCVECTFDGDIKDLRPKVGNWPFLIADDGYNECNRLGAEANASGLGGLLSQSARRPEGTTSPVFSRPCLSGVEFREYRAFDFDPAAQVVTISPA